MTETSAIISWETDQATTVEVLVEGVNVSFSEKFSAGNMGTHFEVELNGLIPGAWYNYSVNLLDKGHDNPPPQYSFQTPAQNMTQFSFAVLGDSRAAYGGGEYGYNGVNATVLRNLVSNAYVKGAEFIIHTGDLVDGYVSSAKDFEMQLKAYKDVVEPVGHYLPMYELMGNHEVVVNSFPRGTLGDGRRYDMITKEGEESAEVIFGNEFVNPTNGPAPDNIAANVPEGKSLPPYEENVYFVDYGNCRFIMINNNYWFSGLAEKYGGNAEGYILDDQKNWLLEKFEDTKNDDSIEHLFIFAQEPMFPVGGQVSNAMWYKGGSPDDNGGWDRTYIYKRRDEIWQAFIDTGKAVAGNFGDEHNYSRTLITHNGKEGEDRVQYAQPVWQIVTGAAGAPFYIQDEGSPWAKDVEYFTVQFSYALYRVDDSRVMLETYSIDDRLLDRIELTKDTTRAGSNIATSSNPIMAQPIVEQLIVSKAVERNSQDEIIENDTLFETSIVPVTQTELTAGEEMEIQFTIYPAPSDVGQTVKFSMVVEDKDNDLLYMRGVSDWQVWDGQISNLIAYSSDVELPEMLEGSLTLVLPSAGQYIFYVGYHKSDGFVVFNGEKPLEFLVK